jgi:small subunit ribosomal protein S17
MADETETTDEQQADAPANAEASPAASPARSTPTERKDARRVKREAAMNAAPMSLEQRVEQRAVDRKRKAQVRSKRRVAERARARTARGDEPVLAPALTTATSGRPKVRQGVVTSAKPDKTIVVRIDIARRHRKYEKIVRSTTKLHAHDETNDAGEGDLVRVSESRPLSRTKRWKLEEVLERAK